MRKLTIREKRLIYATFLLTLLAGGYLFKMSVDYEKNETKARMAMLKTELMRQEEAVQSQSVIETEPDYKEPETKEASFSCPVYEKSNIPFIKEITELLEACGMKAEQVVVSTIEESSEDSELVSDVVHIEKSEPEGRDESLWRILNARIEVEAVGSREQLSTLLDLLESKSWIGLSGFDTGNGGRISLTFFYIMVDLGQEERKE